jgi:hypothetical protein
MIGPCRHATRYTAEHNVCREVDDTNNGIIPWAVNTDIEEGSNACQELEAVVTPNEANVILVKAQVILLHHHSLRRRNGHTGAAEALETHLMCERKKEKKKERKKER